MIIKIIGAVCIIAGCAGVGFLTVLAQKKEEAQLRQLSALLDYMGCELQYRMTPLPQLCRYCATQEKGAVSELFLKLAQEMDRSQRADASECMNQVLSRSTNISPVCKKMLLRLGGSLGKFDLGGQLRGIENTRQLCRKELETVTLDRDQRFRTYQTLGLCAGVALVILFM